MYTTSGETIEMTSHHSALVALRPALITLLPFWRTSQPTRDADLSFRAPALSSVALSILLFFHRRRSAPGNREA